VVIALAAPLILQSLAQAHPGLLAEALTAGVQGPAALGIGRWLNVHTAWDPLGGPIRAEGVENHALRLLPVGPLPTLADLIRAHTLPFRDVAVAGLVVGSDPSPPPPTGP